jgi:hypothetical protein
VDRIRRDDHNRRRGPWLLCGHSATPNPWHPPRETSRENPGKLPRWLTGRCCRLVGSGLSYGVVPGLFVVCDGLKGLRARVATVWCVHKGLGGDREGPQTGVAATPPHRSNALPNASCWPEECPSTPAASRIAERAVGDDVGDHRGVKPAVGVEDVRASSPGLIGPCCRRRRRGTAACCGVSGTPALRTTWLHGIQMPAPDRAAEPPNVGALSTITHCRSHLAAVSAAVIPAAPGLTTTTSYSSTAETPASQGSGSYSKTGGRCDPWLRLRQRAEPGGETNDPQEWLAGTAFSVMDHSSGGVMWT